MKIRTRATKTLIATAIFLLYQSASAQTQPPAPRAAAADPLRTTVENALLSNPDVAARFDAYRASADAIDVARGALRPRLDLNADVGVTNDRINTRRPASDTLSRTGVGLALTQLLWDGMGSWREVDRTNHDRIGRYFDLIETSEQITLEAARTHYDVQRYQHLVALAEDNYIQHLYAMQQIQSRFRAGVGRGVDLEQANARLALAESNLTTESANLHDVLARYLRVVGVQAPAALGGLAVFEASVPANSSDLLTNAVNQSPAISASVEAMRSARAAVQVRESAFQPRIEARVRSGIGHNYQGVQDQRNDSSAELLLNWNLYNGGSDQARVRQQTNILNQAADLRDKACRDVRQVAAIAYNDTRKLTEQLVLLNRNTEAIVKARDAYRQQFDIGQRSLLDLLNAENEVYTARRAYSNAVYDRALAFARTHAGMSQLMAQVGVARPASLSDEANGWAQGGDAPAARCPAEAVTPPLINLPALARRVPAYTPPAVVPTVPRPDLR
jgi:outer membrane protein, adhesin transport system